MFVLHALVLTFVTTPLTLWVYPPSARTLAAAHGAKVESEDQEVRKSASEEGFKTKFSIVLDKLEQVNLISYTIVWNTSCLAMC